MKRMGFALMAGLVLVLAAGDAVAQGGSVSKKRPLGLRKEGRGHV